MNNIRVSIVIPIYNVENYLKECLDSIIHQNFKNYEIICINDASTDNSGVILQDYAKKYNNIRIITFSSNKGLSAARNSGLKNSKGKYIWFIDADDFIETDSIIELYNLAEKQQADIVYFNFSRVYNNNQIIINESNLTIEKNYSGKDFFCEIIFSSKTRPTACMQFIRKDFLLESNINFYDNILHEDELFWFLTSMHAKKIANINKIYYFYRQRTDSIMYNKNYKRAESVFVILIHIISFWNTHSFGEMENEAIQIYLKKLYDTYQYYSCFGKKTDELNVGGEKEKFIYRTLQNKNENLYLRLNTDQIKRISQAGYVIIYGCGRGAFDIVNILREKNIRTDIFGVSNLEENPDFFCGIKVDTIENIICNIESAIVIVGVTVKYQFGILEKLESLGYKDIIIPESI